MRINEVKENCIKYGPEAVINSDLLCIALSPIEPEKVEKLLAENTIVKIGVMTVSQFKKYGFTENQALKINAIFEVARRWGAYVEGDKVIISGPKDVYNALFAKMRGMSKEKVVVLILDTKNKVIKEEIVSIGTLDASIVHPRDVFRPAIECNASSVIIAHNHPSGDPAPSREDILITEKLLEGGKLLGINLLDHIIIGEHKYKSLKDEGFIR